MAKSLIRAIAAFALSALAPTAANAVTFPGNYSFDFSCGYVVGSPSPTCGNSDTAVYNAGNSMTFRSVQDAKLQVKVTAWSINRFAPWSGTEATAMLNDRVTAAMLRVWGGGLGVQNSTEANSDPQHMIDNVGSNMTDFVMLQFKWDVDLNSMTTGYVGEDSDASVRVGTGPTNNPANWASTPNLNNLNTVATSGIDLTDYVSMPTNMVATAAGMNPTGGSSAGSRSMNTNNQHGMTWLIGAFYGASDNNDYFKLDMLNVSVFPTIPEPSTWMTMILGFGFIGGTMRRRKQVFGKSTRSLV